MEIINELSLGKHFTFSESKKMPVYSWFYYKEGFSPFLVKHFIKKEKHKKVLDPFMGSGTTLMACNEMCIDSYGIDVSDLSVFITNTKIRERDKDSIDELQKFLSNLKSYKETVQFDSELFKLKDIFPARNLLPMLKIRAAIENLEKSRDLALLALISIIPMVSYIKKEGGVLRIDKKKHLADVYKTYKKKIQKMINDIRLIESLKKEGKYCNKANALFGDARKMPFEDNMFNAVLTSPPYLNNVDYSKVYNIEICFLTMDKNSPYEIRKRLFPSFVFGKGSYGSYKEMVMNKYIDNTKRVFEEIYRVLDHNGEVFYNISNAIINKAHYELDLEIAAIMESIGFKDVKIIAGLIRKTRINNTIYRVRESVITGKK
jgi:DNA modification methylase